MRPRRQCSRAFRTSLLLAALASCSSPEQSVTVGTALSNSFVDATRMALEEALAVDGLPAIDTLLLSEASNRAAPALELVDRFLQSPTLVGVVGHSNSSASLAAAPLYNANSIVQIAPTSTAASFSQSGPFSFRMVPPDAEQGAFLARVIDSLFPSGTRLAVLFVNDDYGRGLRAALFANLDTLRFPIIFQEPHTDDEYVSPPPDREQRVRATIASVMQDSPDVLLWLGRATTFQLYLQVLRQMAGPIPVLGGDALAGWADDATTLGEWAGVHFADFLDLDASPALRDFRSRYAARFGRQAGTPEVLSYDAMRLLLAAVRDGARSGDAVRRWLESLGSERPAFVGLSGPIAFDPNGDIARTYVLMTAGASRP